VPAEDQPAPSSESNAAALQQDTDELEPQLKYERLGADVKALLQESSATCLCLSEKVLALGTSKGVIHILDYSGNEVKIEPIRTSPTHDAHQDRLRYTVLPTTCSSVARVQVKRFTLNGGPLKHLSFDEKAEYIASSSGDNFVSVRHLQLNLELYNNNIFVAEQTQGPNLVAADGLSATADQQPVHR
jgi:WD40 repeat protein